MSLWLAKKVWVSVQLFYCVERCLSCVLPSLISFVLDYLTTVTLALLQTENVNRFWNRRVGVCSAAYWWVLIKCRTEPRKKRTKCPLSSKADLDLSFFWQGFTWSLRSWGNHASFAPCFSLNILSLVADHIKDFRRNEVVQWKSFFCDNRGSSTAAVLVRLLSCLSWFGPKQL